MSERNLPRNLQNLLRFCLQAGDEPPTQQREPMDPERARWLREALASLTVDVAQKLRESVGRLLSNSEAAAAGDAEAAAACVESLDEAADLCDSIDAANDFVKLGGMEAVEHACQHPAAGVRLAAMRLAAQLAQNNPFAQASGRGVVRSLLPRLAADDCDVEEKFASLSALSCLVRQCPEALSVWLSAGGLPATVACLSVGQQQQRQEEEEQQRQQRRRLRHKAAFLLASLAAESPELAGQLADAGAAEALAACLGECPRPGDWQEQCLRCLLLVAEQRPSGVGAERLRPTLLAVCEASGDDGDPEPDAGQFAECRQYARSLLRLLRPLPEDEAADR